MVLRKWLQKMTVGPILRVVSHFKIEIFTTSVDSCYQFYLIVQFVQITCIMLSDSFV